MSDELNALPAAIKVIVVAVLACSAYLWIRHIQRPRNEISPDAQTEPWKLPWVDFALLICAQVVFVILAQLILSPLIKNELERSQGELTPWIAVFGVLTLQLPLLLTFYAARRFYPNQYKTKLNTQDYSLGAAIEEAVKQFLMFWPLIYMLSFAWGLFLLLLKYFNLIGEFAPQDIIGVLKSNENTIAIGLLVISAAIIAPIVEEIIFRGFLYRFLTSKLSILTAQVVSGIIFAMIHANLLTFMPLAFLGILLARSYEKSGNILVPICFHACFNTFTLTLLFIETSA